MDKIYSFKAKSQTSHLKQVIQQEQKLQFYSEEEGDSTYSAESQNTQQKQQQKTKSKFVAQNNYGYQTDDSDGGTPKNKTSTQPQSKKMSKFSSLVNTKKVDGDMEQNPEFSEGEKQDELQQKQIQHHNDNYNIEEQAKRAQNLNRPHPPKMAKNKQTLSMQNLNVQSENEQVKKGQSVKGKEKIDQHPFRHLIFGPKVNEDVFLKHLLLTQRGLIYAKKCLKGPSDKFIQSKKIVLPEAKVKKDKCLVLDLDETLIHSCTGRDKPQVYVVAVSDMGDEAKIGINIRPYTTLFLQQLCEYYTIYIYTASSYAYANAIISYIDPNKNYISGIMTRNNCMETKNGFFIKDLRLISNKDLKNMIIVDNLAHSFGFQIENGVPILEWHNDMNDQELKYLGHYLIEASKYDDLREFNKQKLKLDELVDFQIEDQI